MSEVDRAHVCDDNEIPPDVVRLNNWVTYRVSDRKRSETKVLVLPQSFSNEQIHLSVLSLLGAAVVGLRVGDQLQFLNYKGDPALVAIESIGAQPGTPALLLMHKRKVKTSGPPAAPDDGPPAA
jgi:regulator of nucleoside diphosphate kinase